MSSLLICKMQTMTRQWEKVFCQLPNWYEHLYDSIVLDQTISIQHYQNSVLLAGTKDNHGANHGPMVPYPHLMRSFSECQKKGEFQSLFTPLHLSQWLQYCLPHQYGNVMLSKAWASWCSLDLASICCPSFIYREINILKCQYLLYHLLRFSFFGMND